MMMNDYEIVLFITFFQVPLIRNSKQSLGSLTARIMSRVRNSFGELIEIAKQISELIEIAI